MKSLSLKQPYAELVVCGKKTIELRKWKTNFRGEFFIHASKNPDKNAMKKFNFTELPLGFIIGKAELIDIKKYNKEDFGNDSDKHLADLSFGSFGFILKNAKRINPIIPAKGKLNFWEFNEAELI
ncbi:ASCH domain-containing protein [Candidatus Pacearchaeota archaeon]|nr:ASCH domain-containing protein [Candidatus Pacearchaeota archaeon]